VLPCWVALLRSLLDCVVLRMLRYTLQARGEMQLAVVIESLRREGMELAVSPPQVVYR
jgi:predicted membrane GTPase involved in stress response